MSDNDLHVAMPEIYQDGATAARKGKQPSENPFGIVELGALCWFAGFYSAPLPAPAVSLIVNSSLRAVAIALELLPLAETEQERRLLTAMVTRQIRRALSAIPKE